MRPVESYSNKVVRHAYPLGLEPCRECPDCHHSGARRCPFPYPQHPAGSHPSSGKEWCEDRIVVQWRLHPGTHEAARWLACHHPLAWCTTPGRSLPTGHSRPQCSFRGQRSDTHLGRRVRRNGSVPTHDSTRLRQCRCSRHSTMCRHASCTRWRAGAVHRLRSPRRIFQSQPIAAMDRRTARSRFDPEGHGWAGCDEQPHLESTISGTTEH